jgi:hypothetical protein
MEGAWNGHIIRISMYPCSLVALAGLVALLAFHQPAAVAADLPIVTVQPACPQWQMPTAAGQPMVAPRITIRYDERFPGGLFRK